MNALAFGTLNPRPCMPHHPAPILAAQMRPISRFALRKMPFYKPSKVQNRRVQAAEASGTAEEEALASPSEGVEVAPRREGYRSFQLEGSEFLVAETPDGQLNLSETFVIDEATGDLERASTSGDIPSHLQHYHDAEWAAEYEGNILQDKPEKRWVIKVYLIALASAEPFQLDPEQVYLLDGTNRSLSRLEVRRLAPVDTPLGELRVRIRENSVVIDTAVSVPTPEAVVRSHLMGIPAASQLEQELAAAGAADAEAAVAAAKSADLAKESADENKDEESSDILYDDDTLKDFLVELDDENEAEFDEYDMPASDY